MIISAVILAAGLSTRFPGNKLLQRIRVRDGEVSLIEFIVGKFTDLFDDVVLVVGHDKEKIIEVLGDKVKFVYNPRYTIGMSESVKVGVKSVMRYSDIVAIHPADVAFILRKTLNYLVNIVKAKYSSGREFILIPRYQGKGGHPVFISKHLLPDALSIGEETRGLKGFLKKNLNKITYVNVDDVGVLADVDTPEDLRRNIELALREGVN